MHLPVLIEDSEIYEFGGLKIAGISGIIARKRKLGRVFRGRHQLNT